MMTQRSSASCLHELLQSRSKQQTLGGVSVREEMWNSRDGPPTAVQAFLPCGQSTDHTGEGRGPGGTGLGLAISQTIVKRHVGTITVLAMEEVREVRFPLF